jgi:hypothetical protein
MAARSRPSEHSVHTHVAPVYREIRILCPFLAGHPPNWYFRKSVSGSILALIEGSTFRFIPNDFHEVNMHHLLSRIGLPAFCVGAALLIGTPRSLSAQYDPTESRGAALSAFGGYTLVQPDYYDADNTGFAAGIAFTRFLDRFALEPSIALRATDSNGTAVRERTVTGGLQVAKKYNRFHPYINLLIGGGSIIYATRPAPGDREDRGRVLSLGGGVDIDLLRNFQLRFDLQQQSWNLGMNAVLKPQGGDFTISPTAIIIGVNYVIPFKPRVGYQDTH